MRVAITGAAGQLGVALASTLSSLDLSLLTHHDLELTDVAGVKACLTSLRPDVVVHCAAMTDVEACAQEPEQAYRVNALGTQNVALACMACDASLAYISTNEVFDGRARGHYREWDAINPINPYGSSKAAGEWFVSHLLRRFYIIRTSWLYSAEGHNFPQRIIELADIAGSVRVVVDEIGNPTYAPDLAEAIKLLLHMGAYGIYHFTNDGFCSRYEFARSLLKASGREHVSVEPIGMAEFTRLSQPPPSTPLANIAGKALGITLRPWEEALQDLHF